MTDPRKKRRSQPTPNVIATLGGSNNSPWVTLRSTSETLIAMIGNLSNTLSRIDDGLEIVETDDALGIRVQPKSEIRRSRAELFTATRRLTRTQADWHVKWND